MWMHKPGLMATQSWWFHEALVTTFKKNSLKVFWCPTWTTEQRAGLIQVIESCLHKSWWETRYDVLGVIGQFLGLDWLQSDKYQYCSCAGVAENLPADAGGSQRLAEGADERGRVRPVSGVLPGGARMTKQGGNR